MSLPKVAIIPTGGTIQNGLPFVTSSKAGGPLNVLRAQRLYEPARVRIAREDRDGRPTPAASGEPPYWTVTLEPADGLYLFPYMESGYAPPNDYSAAHLSAPRLIEEINRFGVDTYGRNNLLSGLAELVVKPIVDPDTGRELRVGGETFTMRDLALIANAVSAAVAEDDIVGCIVTQGTFTTEETACFLHWAVDGDKPVIVCAAQRRHGSIGNDGDWNFVDAVRVAIHPQARGKGVMVVMNEQVLPAREVTKTNQRPDGFTASGGSAEALGSVEDDQVSFYFAPTRRHTSRSDVRATRPLPQVLPRVDIVKTYAGADDAPIRALVTRALAERDLPDAPHQHGIVVEGYAYSGAPHRFQRAALEEAVARHGIPVALANRGDYGRAPRMPESLFVTCDNLMAVKARLLLTLAIHKYGVLTPYRDPGHPTQEEEARLRRQVQRYQRVFDTH